MQCLKSKSTYLNGSKVRLDPFVDNYKVILRRSKMVQWFKVKGKWDLLDVFIFGYKGYFERFKKPLNFHVIKLPHEMVSTNTKHLLIILYSREKAIADTH